MQVDAARYEPVRSLGRGGFGEVWVACDRETGDVVALKILRPDVPREAFARFEREYSVLATLDHPSIVRLLGSGRRADGSPFYVMPYVEGAESLHDWLHRHHTGSPMPPDQQTVVRLLSPVASALDHLHAREILHRDLKPSNLLVTPDLTTRVIDFGLAGLVHSELTRTGNVVGTMGYLSPEQLRGQASPASDQFQLGLTLYELVTGQRPCANLADYVRALAQGASPFAPPEAAHGAVGTAVGDVIRRATAPSPAGRFATCTALVDALAAIPPTRWQNAHLHDQPTERLPSIPIPVPTPGRAPASPAPGRAPDASPAPGRAPDASPARGRAPDPSPAPGGKPDPSPTPAARKRVTQRSKSVRVLVALQRAPVRAALAGGVGAGAALAFALFARAHFGAVRYAPLAVTPGLASAEIQVSRRPAGPVTLSVTGATGQPRTLRSTAALADHRVRVDALGPGERVEVRVVSEDAGAPTTTFTLPAPPIEVTRVRFDDRAMDVEIHTGARVRVALAIPRLQGRTRVATDLEGTTHRLSVPLDGFPFSTRWTLELASGDDQLALPLALPRAARAEHFARVTTWLEERDDARTRAMFASPKNGGPIDFAPIAQAAIRDFPPGWLAAEWGGAGGVLDDPDTPADVAHRYAYQVGRLATFDHQLELLRVPQRYPHEGLYGARFQPRTTTALPGATAIPLPLDGIDPAAPCHLAMRDNDAEALKVLRSVARDAHGLEPLLVNRATARARLPALRPGQRVELVAPLMCGYGRAVEILVNGTWKLRAGRWLRSQPVDSLIVACVEVDPRFLVPGDNTFELSVPRMPAQMEMMFGSADVVVVPPGLTLRVER